MMGGPDPSSGDLTAAKSELAVLSGLRTQRAWIQGYGLVTRERRFGLVYVKASNGTEGKGAGLYLAVGDKDPIPAAGIGATQTGRVVVSVGLRCAVDVSA